jgi:hypothetical protein
MELIKIDEKLDAINPVQASIRPVPYVRVVTKQPASRASRVHPRDQITNGQRRAVPCLVCFATAGWR